jgi:hypothetical protein
MTSRIVGRAGEGNLTTHETAGPRPMTVAWDAYQSKLGASCHCRSVNAYRHSTLPLYGGFWIQLGIIGSSRRETHRRGGPRWDLKCCARCSHARIDRRPYFSRFDTTNGADDRGSERPAQRRWGMGALILPRSGSRMTAGATSRRRVSPASTAISVGRAPTRRCIWSRVRPTISSAPSLPGTIRA